MTPVRLRFVGALVIIGAFVLCIGTLVYFPMPAGNRELLATLTGILGLLARDAARWMFPPAGNGKHEEPTA